jgi:hypothetical protein
LIGILEQLVGVMVDMVDMVGMDMVECMSWLSKLHRAHLMRFEFSGLDWHGFREV